MKKSIYNTASLQATCAHLEIYRDEAFGMVLVASNKKNEVALKKAEGLYWKMKRAAELGYEMLSVGELPKWDWTWVAKNGHLCEKDFEWFGAELAKVGVKSHEDYIKNKSFSTNKETP